MSTSTDKLNLAAQAAFVAARREAHAREVAEAEHDTTMVIEEQQLNGIWKRDGEGAFRSVPGLSLRYPSITIDFTKRQAE